MRLREFVESPITGQTHVRIYRMGTIILLFIPKGKCATSLNLRAAQTIPNLSLFCQRSWRGTVERACARKGDKVAERGGRVRADGDAAVLGLQLQGCF